MIAAWNVHRRQGILWLPFASSDFQGVDAGLSLVYALSSGHHHKLVMIIGDREASKTLALIRMVLQLLDLRVFALNCGYSENILVSPLTDANNRVSADLHSFKIVEIKCVNLNLATGKTVIVCDHE